MSTLRQQAFTRVELAAIIGALLVVAAILVPAMVKARAKAQRINCVNNLKQIGLGSRLFATDHDDRFPFADAGDATSVVELLPRLRGLSNELVNPAVLVCPSDSRRPARDFASITASNLSYFIGLDAEETFPQMVLAGDRNLTLDGVPVPPGLLVVTQAMALGFTRELHQGAANLAMGDGSVQQVTSSRLREMLRPPPGGSNAWIELRLLVP